MSAKDHNWVELQAYLSHSGGAVYSWCSTCGWIRFLSESKTVYKAPSLKTDFIEAPVHEEPPCMGQLWRTCFDQIQELGKALEDRGYDCENENAIGTAIRNLRGKATHPDVDKQRRETTATMKAELASTAAHYTTPEKRTADTYALVKSAVYNAMCEEAARHGDGYANCENELVAMLQDELDDGCLACTEHEPCQCCMQNARIIGAIQGRRDRRRKLKHPHLRNCDGNPCECGADPRPRIK